MELQKPLRIQFLVDPDSSKVALRRLSAVQAMRLRAASGCGFACRTGHLHFQTLVQRRRRRSLLSAC